MLSREVYDTYTELLKSELIEATGCTEPIALALAAAKAREVLGELPEEVEVFCSGNIVKNVKAVVVPNSGGLKGIPVAALLGIVAGDPDASLQVISHVDDSGREALKEAMEHVRVKVILAERVPPLYIRIKVRKGYHTAEVEIAQTHTNFTKIVKDEEVIFSKDFDRNAIVGIETDLLNINDIIEYAETVDLDDVRETIERQIADNTAISREGLTGKWGEKVGRTLLDEYDDSIIVRARAAAAAGSDARMNGCAMPVVINSGSGNQGMTVSLPVIEYAKEMNASHEKLLRALVLSNLMALHQKKYIGYLSAYCGAVSAGAGAGCGICWLKGGTRQMIADTMINAMATIGGMVCDGAKSSCAGKISLSIEAALQGMKMAEKGLRYRPGEGIVKSDDDETVKAVGRMGCEGMKSTDLEILHIMLEE
ncbi:MAG: serine dehydratase subunit alpha family protein [Erysipelotrichaceae bacterium]|nr:serine dehydratase subunit alpha family protein [Erysipelotrichaceae bacterium]